MRRNVMLLTLTLIVMLLGLGAWGQEQGHSRVARLSYVRGDVQVDRLDNTGGDPAQLNMPVTEGERLTTGEDGEAEVEFEDGSVVRVTPESAVELAKMGVGDGGRYETEIAVDAGLAYAEVKTTERFGYRIRAGSDVITPAGDVSLRVDMDEPPAKIAVMQGEVHVKNEGISGLGGYSTDVRAGETIQADTADSSRYMLAKEVASDTWDAWNATREAEGARKQGGSGAVRDKYAGDAGYGWQDLDANGTWYDVPGQGEVWQPDLASQDATTFDPYGNGAWVWTPGPGYVWASGYRWGWVPFHCGSWSYWNGFGWGWAPGMGCGAGFAGRMFGGGGFQYNIANAPPAYQFHPLPGGGWRGGVHPIIPVRTASESTGGGGELGRLVDGSVQRPKTIGGQVVRPLDPVARGEGVERREAPAVLHDGSLGSMGGQAARPRVGVPAQQTSVPQGQTGERKGAAGQQPAKGGEAKPSGQHPGQQGSGPK